MKPMADMPEIVIRTAEEAFPYVVAEDWGFPGRVRIHATDEPRPAETYSGCKTWRFKNRETQLAFAAARIRELRIEGIDNIYAPYSRIYAECPDRRLSPDSYDNPNRKRVRIPRSVPLEW